MRLAGRTLAFALMAAGLGLGWFGLAEMTMEPAGLVFVRMIVPGVALIVAGVMLEAAVWKRKQRRKRG